MKSAATNRAVALTSASSQLVSQLRDALYAATTLDAATALSGSTAPVLSTHGQCVITPSWSRFAFALSQPPWSTSKPIALDRYRPFTTVPSPHTQAASAHPPSPKSDSPIVGNRPETAAGSQRSPQPRAPRIRQESPNHSPAATGRSDRSASQFGSPPALHQRHQHQPPRRYDAGGGDGNVVRHRPPNLRPLAVLSPNLYGVLCEQLDAVGSWDELDRLLRTTPHEMWHGNQLVAAVAAFTRLAGPPAPHRPPATPHRTATATQSAGGASPTSTFTSTSAATSAATSSTSPSGPPEKITSYLRILLFDAAPYLSLVQIKDVLYHLSSYPNRTHPLALQPSTATTANHQTHRRPQHSGARATASRDWSRDRAAAGPPSRNSTSHSVMEGVGRGEGEEAVAVLPELLNRLQALLEGGGFAAPTFGTSATAAANDASHSGGVVEGSGGGSGWNGGWNRDRATGKLHRSILVQVCSSLVRLQQPSPPLARAIAGSATPLLSRGLEGEGLATVMLSLKEHTNADPVFALAALRTAAASTIKLTNPYSVATLLIAAGRCGELDNQILCALASRLADLIANQRSRHRSRESAKGGGSGGGPPKEGLNPTQVTRVLQSCVALGFKHPELLRALRKDIESQRHRLSVTKRLQLAQLLLSLEEDTLVTTGGSITASVPQSPQPHQPPGPPLPPPPPGPSGAAAPQESGAAAPANDAAPRFQDSTSDEAGAAAAASSFRHTDPEGSSSNGGRVSEAGTGIGVGTGAMHQHQQTEEAAAAVGSGLELGVAAAEGRPPLVTEAEMQAFLRRTDLSLWDLLNTLHSLSRLRDPLVAEGPNPAEHEQPADSQHADNPSSSTSSASGTTGTTTFTADASSSDAASSASDKGSSWHVRMPSALTSALLLVDAAAPMMAVSQVVYALTSVTAAGAMVPPSLLLRAQDLYEQPPAGGGRGQKSVGPTEAVVEGGLGTEGGEEVGSSVAGAWTRTGAMVALCEAVGRVLVWQPDAAAAAQLQDSFVRHCRSAAMKAGRHGGIRRRLYPVGEEG